MKNFIEILVAILSNKVINSDDTKEHFRLFLSCMGRNPFEQGNQF